MSRHELKAKNPNHKVIVGWDHPLMTFFIQVIDLTKDEDDERRFILWKGTTPRELYEVQGVERYAGAFAEFTPQVGSTLYGDKDEGR